MTLSARIHAALAKRYQPPEWAFAEEVYRSTGAHARERRADAVAMELYPSRGLHLEGFEVKVSRGDWLRELKQPQKVEDGIFRFCLHWWVVALPGVVAAGELPVTWGLMVLKTDGRLHTETKAPRLEPVAPDWGLVASLLRRATENSVPSSAIDERVREGVAARDQQIAGDLKRLQREHERLVADVRAFQEASGLSIMSGWHGDERVNRDLGETVRRVLADERRERANVGRLKGLAETARRVADEFEREAAALEGREWQAAQGLEVPA